MGDCMLDRTAEDVRNLAFSSRLGHLDYLFGHSNIAILLEGRYAHNLASQRLSDLCEIDGVAVLLNYIHHVHGHHHREAQLGKLRRKIEIALDVGTVNYVKDRIRLLFDEKLSGNLLFE